jgi:glycosyltransferase involved in cell wall biosynthesis
VQSVLETEEDIGLNSGYFRFADSSKQKSIQQLRSHELNFICDTVPCIMDSYDSQYISRALENRILWEELIAENQIAKHKKDFLFTYKNVFVKREWEKALYTPEKQTMVLPVGIDRDKIRRLMRQRNVKTSKPFTFLWTDRFTGRVSNLELLLETFFEAFGDNPEVNLRIVIPGNFMPVNTADSFYVTSSYFHEYSLEVKNLKKLLDLNLLQLMKKYQTCATITFITGVFDDEEYTRELNDADCLIHINSTMEIFPLVLESIAMGKKPVVPDDNRYSGYIRDDQRFAVAIERIPKNFTDDVVDISDAGKFMVVHQPVKQSLMKTLVGIFEDQDSVRIDDGAAQSFLQQHDWMLVAETLRSAIRDLQ